MFYVLINLRYLTAWEKAFSKYFQKLNIDKCINTTGQLSKLMIGPMSAMSSTKIVAIQSRNVFTDRTVTHVCDVKYVPDV